MATQPLSEIVDVEVMVTATGVASPTFNVGLIIGSSTVIPPASRVRTYSTAQLSQMLTDGFLTTSPEYIAASLYASQTPVAQNVMIGVQDLTSVRTVTIGTGGTGYAVGDTATLATGAVYSVSTIGTNGVVTGLVRTLPGTGAVIATNLSTTTSGSGAGLTLSVTAVGDTPVQAVAACRNASANWYLCGFCGAAKADHQAIVQYAQTATPQMQYFGTTSDADALAGLSTSIGGILTAQSYSRWQVGYATTQGGAYPNNIYEWAALMGRAMGLNTGLAGSYFKLPNKNLTGITPEPLTVSQLTAVNSQNVSVYVTYNNSFFSYTPAKTGSSQYFDNVLGMDMAASDAQYALANTLSESDVAVSNSGATTLLASLNSALQLSADRGFLDPGEPWNGPTVLKLTAGMALQNGYVTQAPAITAAMKAARQIPLYACIAQTDAVQSVTIGLYIQP